MTRLLREPGHRLRGYAALVAFGLAYVCLAGAILHPAALRAPLDAGVARGE